jgi:hypothetical protein
MLAEKLNTHSEGKASGFCSAIKKARSLCGAPHQSASAQPPLKAFHRRSRQTATSLTRRRLRTLTAAKAIDRVVIRRS